MRTLVLMLKAPREGEVKTRLARDVGAARATAIYRALVEQQARAAPSGWEVAVHFSPREARAEMVAWLGGRLPAGARFEPQSDGDLGRRLAAAVRTEFARGAERVFLVGGDCPGISATYLAEADAALDGAEVVVGPASDGGYVLLGLTRPVPALFENIAWSTERVLAQTLAAATAAGVSVARRPTLEDVDDVASFERQRARFLS